MLRAAGIVVFRKFENEIQYLLLQTSRVPFHWTPPKGHVDPGESDMETALRETNEEAGFVADDLKFIVNVAHECQYTANSKPKTVIYFLAELISDKDVRLSREHKAFKWVNFEDGCKLAKYQEMVDLLQICHQHIN